MDVYTEDLDPRARLDRLRQEIDELTVAEEGALRKARAAARRREKALRALPIPIGGGVFDQATALLSRLDALLLAG